MLRGKFRQQVSRNSNLIRVGDWVNFSIDRNKSYCIEEIEERRSKFSRLLPNSKDTEQIIAANVDLIFLLLSFEEPAYKTGFIDRITSLAAYNDLKLIICFNKLDLIDFDLYKEDLDMYRTIVDDVIALSILENQGLDKIKTRLKNKRTLVLGPSGVGKSSLINSLDPNLKLKTTDVSDYSGKGQHTTTIAHLYSLDKESFIVDTPGVREFGLYGVDKDELDLFFRDFEDYRSNCKFYNCTHINEPKCAVQEALEAGLIYEERYLNYASLFHELKERYNEFYN